MHYSPRAAWWQGVLRLRSTNNRGIRPWARSAGVVFLASTRRTPGVLGSVRRASRLDLPLDAEPDDIAARVQRARPAVIGGHPHMVIEVGEALAGRYTPKAVATTGETLTAETRAAIRRLFGVEALDGYGTAECGFIAWQCGAADLYHVNHEAVAVEIVDDDGRPVEPGTVGNLVFTSLWNPLMPFVRYRIGDSGAWATRPCNCGSLLPALSELYGRTMNWMIDAEGNRIAPQRLWVSLHLGEEHTAGIDRYRVRQDRSRAVLIEVVAGPQLTPELEDTLGRRLSAPARRRAGGAASGRSGSTHDRRRSSRSSARRPRASDFCGTGNTELCCRYCQSHVLSEGCQAGVAVEVNWRKRSLGGRSMRSTTRISIGVVGPSGT